MQRRRAQQYRQLKCAGDGRCLSSDAAPLIQAQLRARNCVDCLFRVAAVNFAGLRTLFARRHRRFVLEAFVSAENAASSKAARNVASLSLSLSVDPPLALWNSRILHPSR